MGRVPAFFSFALKAGSSSPAEEQSYDCNSTWNAGHEWKIPHQCNNDDLLCTCASMVYFPMKLDCHPPLSSGVYSLYLPIIYPSFTHHFLGGRPSRRVARESRPGHLRGHFGGSQLRGAHGLRHRHSQHPRRRRAAAEGTAEGENFRLGKTMFFCDGFSATWFNT